MSEPRTPNLFIIGSAKCGTTALSGHLAEHPDIYMSEQAGNKEPGYFAPDHPTWTQVSSASEYFRLFENAPPNVRYIGEASVSYLYSKVAASRLLNVSPKAKLLVMVRNPIDVARACHNQLFKVGYETEIDFERAWRLQDKRRKELKPQSSKLNPLVLQYGEMSKLGSHLDRLLQTVQRSQVHVIVYDDFINNPAAVYANLLCYLELPNDGQNKFPIVNPSIEYRSTAIQEALKRISTWREKLGIPGGLGVNKIINRLNHKQGRFALSDDFLTELKEYYHQDVLLLSSLLDRDLTFWVE